MSKKSRKALKTGIIFTLQAVERCLDGLPIPAVKGGVSAILKIIEREKVSVEIGHCSCVYCLYFCVALSRQWGVISEAEGKTVSSCRRPSQANVELGTKRLAGWSPAWHSRVGKVCSLSTTVYRALVYGQWLIIITISHLKALADHFGKDLDRKHSVMGHIKALFRAGDQQIALNILAGEIDNAIQRFQVSALSYVAPPI